MLAGEEIDVVVSDENMPGMGGSEFLKTVRVKYPSTISARPVGRVDDEEEDALLGHRLPFLAFLHEARPNRKAIRYPRCRQIRDIYR